MDAADLTDRLRKTLIMKALVTKYDSASAQKDQNHNNFRLICRYGQDAIAGERELKDIFKEEVRAQKKFVIPCVLRLGGHAL